MQPLKWLTVTLTIVVASVGVVLFGLWLQVKQDIRELELPEPTPLTLPTTVLDRDGKELATLNLDGHRPLEISAIPEVAKQAVLALEDRNYYSHGCYSGRGILRALANNLLTNSTEGASTIAQQYARIAYPHLFEARGVRPTEASYARKRLELVIACKTEQILGKDQILSQYLNRAYFGNGASGLEAASQVYFGHPAAGLNALEAATLAATLSQPSTYNEGNNLARLKDLRNKALEVMSENGWLMAESLSKLQLRPVELTLDPLPDSAATDPQLVAQVRKFMGAVLPEEAVQRGGLTIHLTVDKDLQDLAYRSLNQTLPSSHSPQGALVAIDPRTGGVLAVAGTTSPASPQYNLAVDARRPVGSAMKPFVLQTALSKGAKLSSRVPAPSCVSVKGSKICNSDLANHGYPTLLEATAGSVNTAYMNLMNFAGPSTVAGDALTIGLKDSFIPGSSPPDLVAVPSLALGTSDLSTYELACAYSTWASTGLHTPCHFVEEVLDRDGNRLWPNQPRAISQVISPQVALDVTTALRASVAFGTNTRLNQLGIPGLAAKTGTTEDYRDAREVAYTSKIVVSTWVGFDPPAPMTNLHGYSAIYGGTLPLDITARFLSGAGTTP